MTIQEKKKQEWSRELTGEIEILISVIFFGVSFVFQRHAMLQGIGPITYNACRYTVSTLLLMIAGPYSSTLIHSDFEQVVDTSSTDAERKVVYWKDLLWWGFLCGLTGFGGSMLQQIGLVTLTAGKTGFITGMFVVAVPIVEWLTPGFGAQLNYKSWLAALGSMFGLYLLSGCTQSDSCLSGATGHGEIIVFISMLFWTVGIMWSDIGAKKVNVISLTTVDFAVTTILTIIASYVYEPQYWQYPFTEVRENWVSIVVVGCTEAIAFCLSTLGQMYTPPTRASLLFSMEAVACAILSFFFLNEHLSSIEMVGALFMAGAGFVADNNSSEDDENDAEGSHRELTDDVESVGIQTNRANVQLELPLWKAQKTFGSVDDSRSVEGTVSRNGYMKVENIE